MTLREEILKQAGLLTEMPIRKIEKRQESVNVFFYGIGVKVNNDEKEIEFEQGGDKPNKEEILDYILTSKPSDIFWLAPIRDYNTVKVVLKDWLDSRDAEYIYTGNDAKNIINHITREWKKCSYDVISTRMKEFKEYRGYSDEQIKKALGPLAK